MNRLFKIIVAGSCFCVLFLFFVPIVIGAPHDPECPPNVEGICLSNPLGNGTTNIPGLVGRVVKGLLGVVGAVALVMFIFGGVIWLTAMGEDKKVKQGWDTMTWSATGLAVIFSSYAILQFLVGALFGTPQTQSVATTAVTTQPATQAPISASPTPAAPPAPNSIKECVDAGGSCELSSGGIVVKLDGHSFNCDPIPGISCPGNKTCCKAAAQAEPGLIETDSGGTSCTDSNSNDEDCGRQITLKRAPFTAYKIDYIGLTKKKKGTKEYLDSVGATDKSKALLIGSGRNTINDIFVHGGNIRSYYDEEDPLEFRIFTAHEGGHSISEEINDEMVKRGKCHSTWENCEGIYVGEGHGIFLNALPFQIRTRRDIESYVPQSIRETSTKGMEQFNAYFGHLPSGQKHQVTTPEGRKEEDSDKHNSYTQEQHTLTLLDEMAQFTTGGRAIIDEQKKDPKKYGYFMNNDISSAVEFIPFSLAIAKAIEDDGRNYLTDFTGEPQFKEKLRLLIESALEVYSTEKQMFPEPGIYGDEVAKIKPELVGKPRIDAAARMLAALKTNEDAKDLRDIALKWYGPKWTKKWLGF